MVEVCKKAIVRGHVQGVGYRYTTAMQVRDIGGINGWARNCPDGSVEVVMCGESDALDRLIRWLHHGPDSAVVESVDVFDVAKQDVQGFAVR